LVCVCMLCREKEWSHMEAERRMVERGDYPTYVRLLLLPLEVLGFPEPPHIPPSNSSPSYFSTPYIPRSPPVSSFLLSPPSSDAFTLFASSHLLIITLPLHVSPFTDYSPPPLPPLSRLPYSNRPFEPASTSTLPTRTSDLRLTAPSGDTRSLPHFLTSSPNATLGSTTPLRLESSATHSFPFLHFGSLYDEKRFLFS
jgi:hypothetical protein